MCRWRTLRRGVRPSRDAHAAGRREARDRPSTGCSSRAGTVLPTGPPAVAFGGCRRSWVIPDRLSSRRSSSDATDSARICSTKSGTASTTPIPCRIRATPTSPTSSRSYSVYPRAKRGLVPMISIFNRGDPDNDRVPDGGLFRPGHTGCICPRPSWWWRSSRRATGQPRLLRRARSRLMMVDPQSREVRRLVLRSGRDNQRTERSARVALGSAELTERIHWQQ